MAMTMKGFVLILQFVSDDTVCVSDHICTPSHRHNNHLLLQQCDSLLWLCGIGHEGGRKMTVGVNEDNMTMGHSYTTATAASQE